MRRKGIIEQMAVAERPAVESEVHYPDCDGEPMAENDMQHRAICYASGALRAHFADRPDVHVRGDMFIYYRNGDPHKSIVPDVFVVVGPAEVPLSSYKTWEVGVVPQFVLEVASESTHLRDRDDKRTEYRKLGVREYWRFDPTGVLFRPPEYGETVLGQRLAPDGRYERIQPEADGAVRSEVLELEVCEVGGRLRFRDYQKGEYLRSHTEAEQSVQEEHGNRLRERRLRQEAERAAQEERGNRLRERRLRQEAEQSVQEERGNRLRERRLRQEAERAAQEERGNRLRERRLRHEAERAAQEAEAEAAKLRDLLASATGKQNPNADSQ